MRTFVLLFAPALVASCGGASADHGYDLAMRVRGAQLVEGSLPDPAGGPPITSLEVGTDKVLTGQANKLIAGRSGAGSHAVLFWLDGDRAHWLMPAGLPDSVAKNELAFSARADFASRLQGGEVTVRVQAADGDGRPGEVRAQRFLLVTEGTGGPLVVSLSWDREADLDLHVVDPSGVDISPKNINAFEPPPPGRPPADPDAWKSGAMLDFDSNAGCAIDGRRIERAKWPVAPAAGRYRVYADLFSACGEEAVTFRSEVFRDGVVQASVSGVLYEVDARTHPLPPGAAPGMLLIEFDIP